MSSTSAPSHLGLQYLSPGPRNQNPGPKFLSLVLLAQAAEKPSSSSAVSTLLPTKTPQQLPISYRTKSKPRSLSSHKLCMTWPQIFFPGYFFILLSHSFALLVSEHFLCARHCPKIFRCIILHCPHNNPEPQVLSLALPMLTPCCPSPNTGCTFLPLSFCPHCSHSRHVFPSTPTAKILHDHLCQAQVLSPLGNLPQTTDESSFSSVFISMALTVLDLRLPV